MKVVLFQVPPEQAQSWSTHVDLGLAYLLKCLKFAGHEVEVIDGEVTPLTPSALVEQVGMPDRWILGIKLHSHQIGSVRKYLRRLKAISPGVIPVVGGPHPSSVGERIFESIPEVDFALCGEGEIGFPKLASALEKENPAGWQQEVPGLIFRNDGGIGSIPGAFIEDLDDLGEPPWDEIDLENYLKYKTPIRNAPLIPIITSRGCPFRCTFCGGFLVSGRKVRLRSPKLVVQEMASLQKNFGIDAFAIQDEGFTMFKKHVEAFCDELIETKLKIRWDLLCQGVRPSTLTPELLQKMEKSGCYAMSLSVESANQDVLDDMNKKIDLSSILDTIHRVRRYTKMIISSNFILGYPTETRQAVLNTIRFARRSKVDFANFLLFCPLPGTEITDRLIEQGRLKDIRWESFHFDAPSIPLKDLSLKGLKRMQIWAYLSFYLRPRTLVKTLLASASGMQIKDVATRFLNVLRSHEKPSSLQREHDEKPSM